MRRREPTLADRGEYLALGAARFANYALPAALTRRLVTVAARMAHRGFELRRREVEEHLTRAFPDRDSDWIERTAARTYAHFGREMLSLLRLSTMRPEEVVARTDIDGLDAFMAAVQEGRGVVLVTGHLGNWEIGGAALSARGVALDVVAQRQSNPLVDRAVNAARERLGMRIIERRRAARQGLRSLRAGRVVAFVADQDANRNGVFVPFFGRPASTHRGPALMAVRTAAPIFLGVAPRRGAGYAVRLREIRVDRKGSAPDVVYRLTRAFTKQLEDEIRRAPEQYLWHHRRWKTRPREEPRPGADGITVGNMETSDATSSQA